MGTFTLRIDINRPTADVFAFVAEPRNMPRWYEAVEHVAEITPKTAMHPASYQITRSLPGGRADNIVEVNESRPDLTVTFKSREGPTPFHYRYAVEPTRDGSLLTLDAEISGAGLPGPLAHVDAITTRAFKQGMRHNLEGLKHFIEENVA
jgi:uncharacterized protein YndB with AHSA1/START domain